MKNKKIRVLDFFAGVGAFDSALDRLGVDHELVDAVEIDKYAMKAFNAVHGTNFECQDICEWDKDVGEIDIMWQSSPCQSLSLAGKGHGADKGSGTRSSLVWEVIRIAEKVKPKIICWENVKGLVTKKHKHVHDEYMEELDMLGYNSYWKVLNTKDFLIPQNRERCFTVSIRKDIDDGSFEFPKPSFLIKRLKDIIEPSVDEKYYISSKQLAGMARTKFNSYSLKNLLRDKDGEAKTLTARFEGCPQLVDQPMIAASRGRGNDNHQELEPRKDGVTNTITSVQKDNYVIEPQPIKRRRTEYGKEVRKAYGNHEIEANEAMRESYIADDGVMPTLTASRREQKIAEPNLKTKLCDELVEKGVVKGGEIVNHSYTNSDQRKELKDYIENDTGVMPTLTTRPDIMGYVEQEPNIRIRKLTPKECWRLQGFHDDEFERAEKVVSNAQLYKQAGNSVTVSVIVALLSQLGYGNKKWNSMSPKEKEETI